MGRSLLALLIGCAWICGLVLIGLYVDVAYGCEIHTRKDLRSVLGLYLPASHHMCVTFGQMNAYYVETQICTGLKAPGPTIIYGPLGSSGASAYGPLNSVMINTESSHRDDERALRHEFVRHLLYMNGKDFEQSELYKKCAR